jgi:predicted NAD/FAD-binding protein
MRIAVVGAGVSGLVAAHLLRREHDVTLYEAAGRPGGHANTLELELDGEPLAVDTGFIVYNERTYPLFTRLLRQLGVATRESDMSFGVQCARTGVEWSSRAPFAQRRNLLRPAHWRLLREILRFQRAARPLLAGDDEKVTLADFLHGAGFSRRFVEHYVLPMGAAIWSASPLSFLDFPARSFVRFFHNHGLLERGSPVRWRTIAGGSRSYVDALATPLGDRLRLRAPVRSVRRRRRSVEVWTADAGPEAFDQVVLAVHSDQALRMLAEPTDAERVLLASIAYQANEAVLHCDASLLPRNRRAWASWNVHVPADLRERVAITYYMNRLQGLASRRPLLVTLNRSEEIDPARVLARITYHHPVFDGRAASAQRLRERIDGRDRLHFCGAWWGFGFHEDGVRSAVEMCRRFGLEL